MEFKEIASSLLLFSVGTFYSLAGIFNWKSAFLQRESWLIRGFFGESRSRYFFLLLGFSFIGLGFYLLLT